MSKVDRIIQDQAYIVEVRAWTDTSYTHLFPPAFTKQITIPTTSIRHEGMMTVDSINQIQKLLHDFHTEICDKIDKVFQSSTQTVSEEQ